YNKYYKKYLENYNKYYAYWDYFLDKNIFHEKIPTEIKELITYLIKIYNMKNSNIIAFIDYLPKYKSIIAELE
ncbi:hypothetical protein, partial [Campylobacter canadensis]